MSATRLDQIRARAAETWKYPHYDASQQAQDLRWCLARIEALEWVAEAARRMPEPISWVGEDQLFCDACETWTHLRWENTRVVVEPAIHAPDCPWLALQAAIAGEDGR